MNGLYSRRSPLALSISLPLPNAVNALAGSTGEASNAGHVHPLDRFRTTLLFVARPNLTMPTDTNENFVYPAGILIPANSLGIYGVLTVEFTYEATNNANIKNFRTRISSSSTPAGSTQMSISNLSNTVSGRLSHAINNDGAANAQWSTGVNVPGTTNAVYTSSVDTTSPFYVHLSMIKVTAADSVIIKSISIWADYANVLA